MPAELNHLLQSVRRVLWKHGNIPGERLQHEVDVNGNHRLVVTLRRDEVLYDPPARAKPLNTLGPRVPATRLPEVK